MYKHFLIALLLFVAGAQFSTAQTTRLAVPHDSISTFYLNSLEAYDVVSDEDDYLWRKFFTTRPLIIGPEVDTTQISIVGGKLTTVYHSKVYEVDRVDSLLGLHASGYDSAVVTVHYRTLSRVGDIVGVGPWQYYGAATFTNSTAKGSAAHDSIVAITKLFISITNPVQWNQLVQYRVTVASSKTLLGDGSKRTMSAPGRSSLKQQLWRGQLIARYKRTEQ